MLLTERVSGNFWMHNEERISEEFTITNGTIREKQLVGICAKENATKSTGI